MRIRTVVALLCASPLVFAQTVTGLQPVAVRHAEGVVHGFLVLRELDGTLLANGDLIQTSRGDRVTSRIVFHFKDGSLHDDTAVFSQKGRFRLISDHLVQKGPAFPTQLDSTIDATNGSVTIRYTEKDGDQKVASERLELQPDLANGIITTMVKNLGPRAVETTASMVAATPKPRLVKLVISPDGEDAFAIAGATRRATRYVVKVELGGLTGLVAPLVGKQPPDSRIWILQGDAPAFVKSESPLYAGGPLWRIELTSPVWSNAAATTERRD
jgi:hypothetical protein